MYNWGDSLNKRKHRRKVTKVFKNINKNIAEDKLWRGRFYARIVNEEWYRFLDMSGAYLIVDYEIIDKKTGLRKLCHQSESISFDYHVWEDINNFIVRDSMCWENEERFWSEKYGMRVFDETDWTKVKVEPWSFKKWRQLVYPYNTAVKDIE